tara:strand:+ start:194 stop:919 length:726 start_codon:yes stop_codon:yes gene_type:complete
MQNAFVSPLSTIAIGATDIDSTITARSYVSRLSTVRNGIEKRIDNARDQVSETLIMSVTGFMFVLDNGGESAKAADLADDMGVSPAHASKMRTVGSAARFAAGLYDCDENGKPSAVANNLTYAKALDCANNLTEYWAIEVSGTPEAPSFYKLMSDYLSNDGQTRLAAGQIVRERFGSIENLYKIAKGIVRHADAPEPEEGEKDDDATTWQGMLTQALRTARKQDATEAQIMAVVRAFNNEV